MPMQSQHNRSTLETKLPLEQRTLHAKCFHSSGLFTEFPKTEIEQSVSGKFEQIVKKYPDRIAVKTPKQSLTYRDLNFAANGVASAIAKQDGKLTGPVGVLLTSGWQLLAAMLGAWKAGRFVALLDPMFPSARIAAMLEDCETDLVIAERENLSLAMAAGRNPRLLPFESIERSSAAENPQRQLAPDSFACIVYTSGSTGQAKAVILSHRNMLHQTRLFTNAYHLCAQDRIALLTSGTSNTIHTALLALLNGAALLPFDVRQTGLTHVADWLTLEKISICMLSSPLFRGLCQTLSGKEKFSDLRLLRLRSEAVYKSDFDLYKKYFPRRCLLASGLASSETGLTRNCFFDHDSKIAGHEVPLGYPVEDKDVRLLDAGGGRVGFNAIGEIVVRSRYLSPGYWRRPELTAAKFKADPDGGDERLCFTGDLGMMLPDGCLMHKGRVDFRVKVRGYGVELEEVERTLLKHTGVREAVVVAAKDTAGESRLVAYFTSAPETRPTVGDLRGFLQENLPSYMTPSAFIRLEALPLTRNGKIDRSALPALDNSRPALSTPFKAPKDSTERRLADIWAEVLCLAQVGINDNFFDLGGHSLSAARIISRVVESFQLKLSIDALFHAVTVAEMAAVIRQNHIHKASPQEVARILGELETLSEPEAEKILDREMQDKRGK